MPLATVPSGNALADAAEFDRPCTSWTRQDSGLSTEAPSTPGAWADFSRATTLQTSDIEANHPDLETGTASAEGFNVDFYETRGGLAAYCQEKPELRDLHGGEASEEVDFYEARGGMVSLAEPARLQPQYAGHDGYEVRGGMAAAVASGTLPKAVGADVESWLTRQHLSNIDLHEVRGGLEGWLLARSAEAQAAGTAGELDLEAAGGVLPATAEGPWGGRSPQPMLKRFDVDFYEARGGLAACCRESPEKRRRVAEAPVCSETVGDLYEMRGGMASCPAVPSRPDVDFYEVRGGMSSMASKPAVSSQVSPQRTEQQHSSADMYEVRGGFAEWLAAMEKGQLSVGAASTKAPSTSESQDSGSDIDFYEARGGLSTQCRDVPEICKAMEDGRLRHPGAAAWLACQEKVGIDLHEVRGGLAEWMIHAVPMSTEAADLEDGVRGTSQQAGFVIDFYEARGGMATLCREKPEVRVSPGNEVASGDASADFYETRGGLASLLAAQRCDVDFYEVRGGMAALCREEAGLCQAAVCENPCDSEADFYEMRGGMASQAAAKRFDVDFYEARGGLATWCQEKPECSPRVAEDVADFYEVRGGLAHWVGA